MARRDSSFARLVLLREEATVLNQRLQRTAVALAMTQDALADILDQVAGTVWGPQKTDALLEAKRARSAAGDCRDLAIRLDELSRRR